MSVGPYLMKRVTKERARKEDKKRLTEGMLSDLIGHPEGPPPHSMRKFNKKNLEVKCFLNEKSRFCVFCENFVLVAFLK